MGYLKSLPNEYSNLLFCQSLELPERVCSVCGTSDKYYPEMQFGGDGVCMECHRKRYYIRFMEPRRF